VTYASRYLRLEKDFMQGPDVAELQKKLAEYGFDPGKKDGIYGPKTDYALRAFQKSSRLPVDGIVGPETWIYLNCNMYQTVFSQQIYYSPSIIIDVEKKRLLYSSSNLTKQYKVGVGKKSTPTPLGNWYITQKALNPGGPFGVRWMRLSVPWGGYGIHGTNNPKRIGTAVSHGCVRMYNDDVIELYDMTPIGTPVTIIGRAYTGRLLQLGDKGTDVKEVQKWLKSLKYYKAKIDGYFGPVTEKAVIIFQKDKYLVPDGIVGPATYNALQKSIAIGTGDTEP